MREASQKGWLKNTNWLRNLGVEEEEHFGYEDERKDNYDRFLEGSEITYACN